MLVILLGSSTFRFKATKREKKIDPYARNMCCLTSLTTIVMSTNTLEYRLATVWLKQFSERNLG